MPTQKTRKSRFAYGFKKACETHSITFRKELGLEPYDYLPARKLAEYLSVQILSVHDINGLAKKDIDTSMSRDDA